MLSFDGEPAFSDGEPGVPSGSQEYPSTLDLVFAGFVHLCSKSPVQASFFFTLEQYLTLNEAF